MLYVGEGPRGSNGACSTLCRILVTPSATHNQIEPLWCCFPGGWVCAHSRPLWVSPTTSPVRLEFLLLLPQSPRVFSIRGLRLYFPALEHWVVWSASLPHRSSRFICAQLWGHRIRQPPWLPISTPPTGLDKCFFFISLVVRLPFSLIFCQFWLFLFLNCCCPFFWLCEEAQCVYLRLHLGWK